MTSPTIVVSRSSLASLTNTLAVSNGSDALQAGDIFIVGTTCDGTIDSTGITGSGLTFARRGGATSGASSTPCTMSIWYAVVPSGMTGYSLTVAFTGSFDDAVASWVIIRGAYAAAPFDPNGSLPAKQTGAPPGSAVTYSTTRPDDLLLFFFCGDNGMWVVPPPSTVTPGSWSYATSAGNSGGFGFAAMGLYTLSVSSAQTAQTVNTAISIGTKDAIFYVDAITADTPPPGVPTSLACGGSTTSQITPTWAAGSGSAPTSYTLQWRLLGSASWNTIAGITGTSQAITGLLPGSQYEWQVEATNSYGTSAFTVSTVCWTVAVPAPVPGQPQSLGLYRGQVGINYNGLVLVGDAFSGVIGSMDFQAFTEYGNTMRGLVSTPPVHEDRARVFVKRFEIDIESGVGLTTGQGSDPVWMLDWSKDGGRTWQPLQVFRSMGRIGAFLTRLRWLRLGESRQWVFRLQATDPVRRVIVGTYLDVERGMK